MSKNVNTSMTTPIVTVRINEASKTLHPGESVSGKVKVYTASNVDLRLGVKVKLAGLVEAFWIPKISTKEKTPDSSKTLFSEEKTLTQFERGTVRKQSLHPDLAAVEMSTKIYSFSFHLPQMALPRSFLAYFGPPGMLGKVEYSVEASVNFNTPAAAVVFARKKDTSPVKGGKDTGNVSTTETIKEKGIFDVETFVDISSIQNGEGDSQKSSQFVYSSCCGSGEPLTIEVNVQPYALCPGHMLTYSLKAINMGGYKVTNFVIRLEKTVRFHSNSGLFTKDYRKILIEEEINEGMDRKKKFTWQGQLQIPVGSSPSQQNMCEMVSHMYFFAVSPVVVNGFRCVISSSEDAVQVPIVIASEHQDFPEMKMDSLDNANYGYM